MLQESTNRGHNHPRTSQIQVVDDDDDDGDDGDDGDGGDGDGDDDVV